MVTASRNIKEAITKRRQEFKLSPAQAHMFFESSRLGRFRIFPKGRRLGATRGASIAMSKWANDGMACLWGDTINGNIDRYVERYFKPFLNIYNIPYKWSVQKKLLQVGNDFGYIDFRSADRPENWEGFGYHRVFLNEAGIILNDEYLYYNAVLPMLMDFEDSELIAAGTPKLLGGKGRLFYDLYKKAKDGEKGYYTKTFSTYDNPFIPVEQVEALKMEIPSVERGQEIYGKFILSGGSIVQLAWFKRYRIRPATFDKITQSWDTASKEKEMNDPSVCTTWGEVGGNYYLIDVYVQRLVYPALRRTAKSLAEKWNPDQILIEDKSSGIALIQDLREDTTFPYNIKPIEPVRDKVTRMSTCSLTIEAGRVYLPESAPWLPSYETELSEFPAVDHDDQSDSTSQFLNDAKTKTEIFIG